MEALFKGGLRVGENVAAAANNIRAEGEYGANPWFSANVGPKGSYRLEHVLAFMQRHLPPMIEGRQWRIPMRGVRTSHLG
ncbi:MAG: hypothetical protein ACKPKO_21395, partial [Candidatus Fonsibacter sp.]